MLPHGAVCDFWREVTNTSGSHLCKKYLSALKGGAPGGGLVSRWLTS